MKEKIRCNEIEDHLMDKIAIISDDTFFLYNLSELREYHA